MLHDVITKNEVITLIGWPTDAFAIDHPVIGFGGAGRCEDDGTTSTPQPPVHTLIIFVPGNPGLVEWYVPFFERVVSRLGPGFATRGAANAGHSVSPERIRVDDERGVEDCKDRRDRRISWSVDGQVMHKMAFVDYCLEDFRRRQQSHNNDNLRLVFVSHSIGAHFAQRVLVLRPDILEKTCLVIHLMPFVRMDAPVATQALLNLVAAHPELTIGVHEMMMKCLAKLPLWVVDLLLRGTIKDPRGRRIASQLVRQPAFARNFFTLGTEEIRDVPKVFDACAMQIIAERGVRTVLLYAGGSGLNSSGVDHWAPASHIEDLRELERKGALPSPSTNLISIRHEPSLQHDFVADPSQVDVVVDLCVEELLQISSSSATASGDTAVRCRCRQEHQQHRRSRL